LAIREKRNDDWGDEANPQVNMRGPINWFMRVAMPVGLRNLQVTEKIASRA